MNGYLKMQNATDKISLIIQYAARKSAKERHFASVEGIRCNIVNTVLLLL